VEYESAELRIVRVIALLCGLLATVSLSLVVAAPRTGSEATVDPGPQIVRVDWSRFAPDTELRVKRGIASGDCSAMLDEYRRAVGHDVRRRLRSARGAGQLLAYVRAGMNSAGCGA
jgi:hypothetical protein